ncbi:methyltransferase-like protein KIAA1627 homolog [Methylorubrum populi]|uniref:Methyltransferase-like protein KIAA1627 homolog n=1 Tax=Methylorubrum populi TaxID=223967 RepID=A0A160PK89_9HYPH|nr:ParB/RepB/Spo0J family partition protein [Methylorubrum populi]BAU93425.1 methyltransferase-like protein KIAA1627 homolog [Methylorubrum populi]
MLPQDLPISHVFTRQDARKIDEAAVRGLMESIREIGVINPLRVRPARKHVDGEDTDAYEVTAGSHRLRACRKLGLELVPCIVVADDDLRAELAMIDENLMRAELSPADRARGTARRKAIYEELHPETRHGVNQHDSSRQVGDCSERFSAETAAATGRSERAVQRDAERGEKISERALALVAGTHLDKGNYLDKLKKLGPNEQEARVQRELAAVQAPRKPIGPSDPPRNDFEIINKDHRALVRAWENAHPDAREKFLTDIGAVLDTPVFDRGAA